MFKEYPKVLYKSGELEGKADVVFNADEEAELRKQGYKSLAEPQEKSPSKGKK
jgi:hypothetical protein